MRFLAALCLSAIATFANSLALKHQERYEVTGTPGIDVDPSAIRMLIVSDNHIVFHGCNTNTASYTHNDDGTIKIS